jgi:hypothetical protein
MEIKVKEIRKLVRSALNEMGLPALAMGSPEQQSSGLVSSVAEKLSGSVIKTGTSGKTGQISCELDGQPVEITVVITLK